MNTSIKMILYTSVVLIWGLSKQNGYNWAFGIRSMDLVATVQPQNKTMLIYTVSFLLTNELFIFLSALPALCVTICTSSQMPCGLRGCFFLLTSLGKRKQKTNVMLQLGFFLGSDCLGKQENNRFCPFTGKNKKRPQKERRCAKNLWQHWPQYQSTPQFEDKYNEIRDTCRLTSF